MAKRRHRPGPEHGRAARTPGVEVISRAPVAGDSEFNQVGVLIIEENLGFSRSTLAQVRAMCRRLPFEPAMSVVASLAGHIEAAMASPAKQLTLAEAVFAPGPVLDRYRELLKNERRLQIWGPQSLYVVMRLLIEEAMDAPISQQLTVTDKISLLRVLIASNTIVESGQHLGRTPDLVDLLAFETQIGSYYARPTWLEDMTRPQALLRVADTAPLSDDASYVPINGWIDRSGLNSGDQWELGFGLGAVTNAWDAQKSPWIDQEVLDDVLAKLEFTARRTEALALVSAARDEIRASFMNLGVDPERVAWEARPFNRTPFLRLREGGILLMGRPWIQNWLGDGFYYRALDVARELDNDATTGRTDHVQRYTQYMGLVFEKYCVDRAKEAFPAGTPVVGEQSYSPGGGAKTTDIAVLIGRDLVLFEVHGRRPAAEPLISGDPVEIVKELRKLLLKKINQLGGVVGALEGGRAKLPGIDYAQVRLTYPVVVNNGRLWQTPRLWQYLDGEGDPEKSAALNGTGVQPVQAFDASDFEMLLALASKQNVAGLLRRKTSGKWRARDLASWFKEDPAAPKMRRLPFTDKLFLELTAGLERKLVLAAHQGGEDRAG